jgi:hypothetical protein
MRWIIHPQVRSEISALDFCKEFIGAFDTSSLDWIRIDLGRGTYAGAYGRCWYPTRSRRKGYRISVQVPGPFPYSHRRYIKPLYENSDGSWPPIPFGATVAGTCQATRNGVVRRWQRLTVAYRMETRAIALVHIFAHEAFHFLRRSQQIPGRNRENEADLFAVSIEATFRERIGADAKAL